jgi:EmrB/QacA subfamily drug resistance transporter
MSAARRPAIALAIVLFAQLMMGIDASVVAIALPSIRTALHFSASGLSWTLTAYTLTFGGLLLLGGRAGDILGRRRVFLVGVTVFTLASLLAGLAPWGWLLLGMRGLQGAAAAFIGPSVLSLITTTVPAGEARNRALALFSIVGGAGASAGLVVGGLLTALGDWRWIFFVNVPLGIAVLLLTPRFVAEPERHPGRFDVTGALLSTSGMLFMVYGVSRLPVASWRDTQVIWSVASGALLMVWFAVHELRVDQPLTPPHLLADRSRVTGYLTAFLATCGMYGSFFFLSQFLQDDLRFSPFLAGLAFIPMTGSMFGTVRIVPRLMSRYGARPLVLAGLTSMIAGALVVVVGHGAGGYAGGVLGPMLLLGFGAGLTFVPVNVTLLATVAPRDTGAASGLLQASQYLGGSVGLAVLVAAAGRLTGGAALSRAYVTSGALFVLAWVLVAVFLRVRRPAASVPVSVQAER